MNIAQNPPKGLAGTTNTKVVSLFSGQPYQSNNSHHIVRLAPELDHLEVLYNDSHAKGEDVYRANILFWALLSDGSVVGMIPWLDQLICCADLNHPGMGAFLGYFDPAVDELLNVVPEHKRMELQAAADHFHFEPCTEDVIIQELPDTCGTHVIFSADQLQNLSMSEVFSWQLLSSGKVQATIINLQDVERWPVLLGDAALETCQSHDDFYGFLQYRLAVKLKQTDKALNQHLKRLVSSQGSYAKLLHSQIKR